MLDCASELAAAGVSVLHAIGPNNADQAEAAAPLPSTHVVLPYISDMAAAYAAADLAVESYVRMFEIDAFIVRPFNNYGPRQNHSGPLAGIIPITARRVLAPWDGWLREDHTCKYYRSGARG